MPPAEGGWEPIGPSPEPFAPGYGTPRSMTSADIDDVVDGFAAAARRALDAGFRVIELHMAHGYLMHQFLSPLVNRRSDEYGGSFENRTRLPLRAAQAVRRRVAGRTAAVRAHLGHRLGGGGLGSAAVREARARAQGARGRPHRLLERRCGGGRPDPPGAGLPGPLRGGGPGGGAHRHGRGGADHASRRRPRRSWPRERPTRSSWAGSSSASPTGRSRRPGPSGWTSPGPSSTCEEGR